MEKPRRHWKLHEKQTGETAEVRLKSQTESDSCGNALSPKILVSDPSLKYNKIEVLRVTSKFKVDSSLVPQSQVFHKHYLSHPAQFYSF